MPVAIALIRGINVGGKHKLPMVTLRSLCEALGWKDVATLIQSGNVVFRCTERQLTGAAGKLEVAIEEECGFRPGVSMRSLAQLRAVPESNPFEGVEPNKLLVMFLAGPPDGGARRALASIKPDPEKIELIGSEVYLHYPDGVGKSKLAFTVIEKAVKVAGTTRNWNTVTKLLAMAEKLESGS